MNTLNFYALNIIVQQKFSLTRPAVFAADYMCSRGRIDLPTESVLRLNFALGQN